MAAIAGAAVGLDSGIAGAAVGLDDAAGRLASAVATSVNSTIVNRAAVLFLEATILPRGGRAQGDVSGRDVLGVVDFVAHQEVDPAIGAEGRVERELILRHLGDAQLLARDQ